VSDTAPLPAEQHVAWIPSGSRFGRVSSDGRLLPFSGTVNEVDQLWLHDLVGGGDRQITRTKDASEGHLASNGSAALSRSADRVLYSWRPNGEPQRQELRLSMVDGSLPPRVVVAESRYQFLYPSDWSPDGNHVAVELEGEADCAIGVVSIGDGTIKIVRTGDVASNIVYSNDGRYLAFDTQPKGKRGRDIYLVDASGGADRPVVERPGDDQVIGWLGGLEGLVYASDRSGIWDLWSQRIVEGRPDGAPRLLAHDVGRIDVPLGGSPVID